MVEDLAYDWRYISWLHKFIKNVNFYKEYLFNHLGIPLIVYNYVFL
jgi:hypothetical protein